MKCSKCSQEIPDNSLFCTFCGEKIVPTQTPPASAETVANTQQNFSNNPYSSSSPQYNTDPGNYTQKKEPAQSGICTVCGGQIDPGTKRCTRCGKSYAKSSGLMIALIAVSCVAVILAGTTIFTSVKFKSAKESIASQQSTIASQQSTIDGLNETINDYKPKAEFMDEYVVIVVEGDTKYYHKFGCPAIADKTFWVFNVNYAVYQGYTADPYCD